MSRTVVRRTTGKGLFLCLRKVWFVHFNMAAYTLPEGFTEFDMFTFGSALLVGGKCTELTQGRVSAGVKGTVRLLYSLSSEAICSGVKKSIFNCENLNHAFFYFHFSLCDV